MCGYYYDTALGQFYPLDEPEESEENILNEWELSRLTVEDIYASNDARLIIASGVLPYHKNPTYYLLNENNVVECCAGTLRACERALRVMFPSYRKVSRSII